MKFFSLLKKELREMLSPQTIIILVFLMVFMYSMGGMMNSSIEEANEESGKITICDLDNTNFSQSVLTFLEHPTADMQNEVEIISLESDDYAAELDRLGIKSFVIIPKGFTDSISAREPAEVIYVSRMTSLSTMSNVNAGSEIAVQLIQSAVKTAYYTEKVNQGALSDEEITLLESPVNVTEQTIVNDKSEPISQMILYSSVYEQAIFMPLIVYMLILMGSQTMINAVSAEKLDKTLETLLSAPVSRLSVLSAKMLAAAIIALLNALVYMVGMNNITPDMTGELGSEYAEIAKRLGITFDLKTYLLIGLQMLVTMLIALSISMILGVFAKNVKSSQTLVLPLMFVTIAPFMVSMFIDISSLPGVVKYLLYAIPFTHTFMASDCIIFGKTELYTAGLIYQIVFLIICMAVAVHIFKSDKIFTANENSGIKKKKKKVSA